MHDEAMGWLRRIKPLVGPRARIADLGSFNVNGGAREVFEPGAELYVGVDTRDGPGVDVIANAAWWRGPEKLFDLVVCTECLEHTPYAAAVCHNAYRLLEPAGIFLVTTAGPKRKPHSCDGDEVLPDREFYKNVSESELRQWLLPFAVALIQDRDGIDLYALAVKGEQP